VTIEELNNDLEQAVTDLTTVYAGFYLCCADLKDAMQERIFVKSLGTFGQDLTSRPYSTEPIYVDTDSLITSLAAYKFGKPKGKENKGKPIKSAYFEGGYAELKKATGRPRLELTNNLALDFRDTPQVNDFNTVKLLLDENNLEKVKGLEFGNGRGLQGYGEIFFPTDDELNELVLCLEEKANETLER
jgi:hypothetical protein